MMEMTHNFENSLCCGGGGGGMWLDGYRWEIAENRLSEWRVREAVSAQEEKEFSSVIGKPKRKKSRQSREEGETFERRIMVVACPYEPPRFEDAIKAIPEANGLVVKDITEVLVEAMDL
jgi:Fe-S oxidoreductase